MRQGRFAGLGAAGHKAVAPPRLADVLLFDLRACDDEENERVAAERAHSLNVSLPFLAASHALWAVALLFALIQDGAAVDWAAIGLPLAFVLFVDAGLCWLLRNRRSAGLRPHSRMRFAAAGALATAVLWMLVIASVPAGEQSML